MKYCPYCGAALVDSAAIFCAECGRSLPAAGPQSPSRSPPARSRPPVLNKPAPPGRPHPARWRKPAKPAPRSIRHFIPQKKPAPRQPEPVSRPKPDPRDDGYDGYYNDVKPIDNGHTRDRMDPELVKRIAIIAASAFILVIFSVILMYLL